jgi:hypothetical protein
MIYMCDLEASHVFEQLSALDVIKRGNEIIEGLSEFLELSIEIKVNRNLFGRKNVTIVQQH